MKTNVFDCVKSIASWINKSFSEFPKDAPLHKILLKPNAVLAIFLFALGIFFCFFSMKFKKTSLTLILTFFIYEVLGSYENYVKIVAEPVDNFISFIITPKVREYIPDSIANLIGEKDTHVIGYLLISFILALITNFLIKVSNFASLILIYFFMQKEMKIIFAEENKVFQFAYIIAAVVTTFIMYLVQRLVSYVFQMGCLCFIGSSIVLCGTSHIFNYPKNFDLMYFLLFKKNTTVFRSVNFIYLLFLTVFSIIAQVHLYKESKF